MNRLLVVINRDEDRARAARYVADAPLGTRVEFKSTQRTLPQNARMWAMLTDISEQRMHMDNYYTPDEWKALFLHAVGRETKLLPALEGGGIVALQSSRDLSVQEMSDMIETITVWGLNNGVVFSDNGPDA